jgi:hypothetical protein
MERAEQALLADVIDGLVMEPELVASVLHVVLQPLAEQELAALEVSRRIEVVGAIEAAAVLAASSDVSAVQLRMLFDPVKALGVDGVGVFVQALAEHNGAPCRLYQGSVREQLRAKLDNIVAALSAKEAYSFILEEFAELSAESILADFARTGSEAYAANLLYSHERLLRHLTSAYLKRRINALDAIVAYL